MGGGSTSQTWLKKTQDHKAEVKSTSKYFKTRNFHVQKNLAIFAKFAGFMYSQFHSGIRNLKLHECKDIALCTSYQSRQPFSNYLMNGLLVPGDHIMALTAGSNKTLVMSAEQSIPHNKDINNREPSVRKEQPLTGEYGQIHRILEQNITKGGMSSFWPDLINIARRSAATDEYINSIGRTIGANGLTSTKYCCPLQLSLPDPTRLDLWEIIQK